MDFYKTIKIDLILFVLLAGAPDDTIELLPGEVEAAAHEGADSHEGGSLGRAEDPEHGVNPEPRHVVDEVHPGQVGEAE